MEKLEFLKALEKAGVQFGVHAIDGYLTLTSAQVLDYLKNPDAFLAQLRGITLEQWLTWKHEVAHHHTIPLKDWLKHPTGRIGDPLIPDGLRWEVWERDNFTCQHCRTRRHLAVDHIIPTSKGGQTIKENLQTLCNSCNSKKGNQLVK